jgi:hypothetical protein
MLSYLNAISWTAQSIDSGTVTIAPNSSNEHSFYTSIEPSLVWWYGSTKKAEVIVDNGPWGMPSMWGDCVWIKHSFQISLIDGQGEYMEKTTDTPPRVDYTLNVPGDWNALGGVRISNPENQPVAVTVEVILHTQTVNSFWETAMIIGLIVAVIGIVLIPISFREDIRRYGLIGGRLPHKLPKKANKKNTHKPNRRKGETSDFFCFQWFHLATVLIFGCFRK